MMADISAKFYENILEGIKVIERTRFFLLRKMSKGHNSVKNVGKVSR